MKKLYLDMNIYKRTFDDQTQLRIRLESTAIVILFTLIEMKVYDVCWSFVLAFENSLNPSIYRREVVARLAQLCAQVIEPDEAIREMARNLHGVSGRDALHLACAEFAGCDYFVTCDDRLVKKSETLRAEGRIRVEVINPVDLVRWEVEHGLQF